MTREIEDAVRRYEDRKDAAYGDDRSDPGLNQDGMRSLLIGLDLDIEELHEYRILAVQAALRMYSLVLAQATFDRDKALAHTLAGTWVDGIVTGLLIAEARDE